LVPDVASGQDPLQILLWIHGLPRCGETAGSTAIDFIRSKTMQIAQVLLKSGKAFVLVAPSMNYQANSYDHLLTKPANLNAFLGEIRNEFVKIGWGQRPQWGRLVLAGHSRAFVVLDGCARLMSDAAMSTGPLAKLTNVWSLDAMLSSTACTPRVAWASSATNVDFQFMYRLKSMDAWKSECVDKKARASGLTNVTVRGIRNGEDVHCGIPRTELPGLLETL
jgi:hypothetical protein